MQVVSDSGGDRTRRNDPDVRADVDWMLGATGINRIAPDEVVLEYEAVPLENTFERQFIDLWGASPTMSAEVSRQVMRLTFGQRQTQEVGL